MTPLQKRNSIFLLEKIHTYKRNYLSIVFFLIAIFLIIPPSLNASPDDSCPGSLKDTLSLSDTSYSNYFKVRKNSDPNDYIYFDITEAGIVSITADEESNRKYNLSVSKVTCGGTDVYGRTSAKDHTVSSFPVSAGDRIYVRIDAEGYSNNKRRDTDFSIVWSAPPTSWFKSADGLSAYTLPSPYQNNLDITETLIISGASQIQITVSGETETGYDYLYITDAAGDTQTFHGSINQIYVATGPSISLRFTSDGNIIDDGVSVSIIEYSATANDDSYTTLPGTDLTSENVLDNDYGPGITITDNTEPSDGTLTLAADGTFTYSPDTVFIETDSFTYTITDDDGKTDTATVTINMVAKTSYGGSNLDFYLVNPPSSQNIRGDFRIAGNTVECLTDSTSSFDGTCQDDASLTDNNRMVKYIDIDGDSTTEGKTTWNSSSSYFNIPDSYEQDGGKGIVWAGLFWQGNINTDNGDSDNQRLAVSSNGGTDFTTVEMDTGDTMKIEDFQANKIKLKINTNNYADVTAKTLNANSSYTDGGATYAAYADITGLIQDANLASGDNNFTIANLSTNEGREANLGNYGGWSLVLIFLEDLNGKARNISIYNGFKVVKSAGSGTFGTPAEIKISGFKLPGSGTISSSLAMFAGEGEHPYTDDTVQISNTTTASNFTNIPVNLGTDSDNIFNAKLDNILRENIPGEFNNLQNNNDGIDIDVYNIGSTLEDYRDLDEFIDTIYLELKSSLDYITPSMVAFSTELYTPDICYEYTYDIGGYVIDTVNNDINTSYHKQGFPLTTHLAIRSQEADLDLENVSFTITSQPEFLTYKNDSMQYAGNNINDFDNILDNNPQIHSFELSPDNNFTLNIGANVGGGLDGGGTLSGAQTYFSKFEHDFNATTASESSINTSLQMTVSYSANFGSGDVTFTKVLDEDSLCEGSESYDPEWGRFNVIDGSQTDTSVPNLYTQVSNKNFSAKIVGFKKDGSGEYTVSDTFNTNVEIEIINVDFYGRDSNLSCANPDSNIIDPIFKRFGSGSTGSSEVSMGDFNYTLANRNTAYRVWFLQKSDGSLLEHIGDDRYDDAYYGDLYNASASGLVETEDKNCSTVCPSSGDNCYTCIRKYWGQKTCSRDNFSIRPDSFKIDLYDNNQADTGSGTYLSTNDSSTAKNIAAGYNYQFKLTATQSASDNAVLGYIQGFGQDDPEVLQSVADGGTYDEDDNHSAYLLNGFASNVNCPNLNSEAFEFSFWDGAATNMEVATRDVGDYKLHIIDNKWTEVDNPGQYGQDCYNPNVPSSSSLTPCNINSNVGTARNDFSINSRAYDFNITSIQTNQFNKGPNSTPVLANDYIYNNNIFIDQNMTLRYNGAIHAVDANNNDLLNFTDKCYSQKVSFTIDTTLSPANRVFPYTSAIYSTIGGVKNLDELTTITDTGVTVQDYNASGLIPPTATEVAVAGTISQFTSAIGTESFTNGIANVEFVLNYDRAVNGVPPNPITLSYVDFNAACTTPADCQSLADLGTNNPSEDIIGTSNVTHVYARAHSPRMRVSTATATIPLYYEFYCDSTIGSLPVPCAYTTYDGSMVTNPVLTNGTLSPDSIRWYVQNLHDTTLDGNVTGTQMRSSADQLHITTSTISGDAQSATYAYDTLEGYPFKTTVQLNVPSWLVYHRWNAGATFNTFELEFFNLGGWAGSDNSKISADTNASSITNRRIQW